jgi:hypothetical protein
VKKLIFLIALGAGIYYYALPYFGIKLGGKESEAVTAYKQFADAYVAGDYDRAQVLSSGRASRDIEDLRGRSKVRFMGQDVAVPGAGPHILERSVYDIKSEVATDGGRSVRITAVMSAAVSYGGSTAIRTNPKSYVAHDQTAVVNKTPAGWRIVEFSDSVRPRE